MKPIHVTSSDMSNLMPFLLAILLIFVIPMLMSRYGISADDLLRKLFSSGLRKKQYDALDTEEQNRKKTNKKPPHLNNSSHQDIIQMVSDLIIFSRKNKTGLVYPGTIRFGGKTGNLAAFVVTRSRIIGLNCFGFAGTITQDRASGRWTQQINGITQSVPDPLKLNDEQYRLARSAMDANGMKDLPLEVAAVFTNRHVHLDTAGEGIYTAHDLIAHLAQIVAEERDEFDPEKTSKRVNEIVYRIRKK